MCYYRGELDHVACQATINNRINKDDQEIEFLFDSDCNICVYAGADAEKSEENLDRQIETRDEVTQVMISSRDRSIVVSLTEKRRIKENTREAEIIRKYQVEEAVYEHPKLAEEEG